MKEETKEKTMKNLFFSLIKLYTKTPFYPHWLEFKDANLQFQKTLDCLNYMADRDEKKISKLLEIGCGNKHRKPYFFHKLGISQYYGLDYPAWINANVPTKNKVPFKSNFFSNLLFGDHSFNADIWGDAHALPFPNEAFDYVCHFGTMEHLENLNLAFSETIRCLKQQGFLFFGVPFLYQEHGVYDISRITRKGIIDLCSNNGLEYLHFFPTGFGSTLSQLINSFCIKNIIGFYRANKIRVIFGTLIFSPIFLIINIIGLILNQCWNDPAYANQYLFIFKKKIS